MRDAALTAGLVVAAACTLAAQQPTFATRVEAVRVDVLVTDRGQVVSGLRPQDFEVRDNGVLQEVDFVSLQQLPLNVILGLDISASVSGERLEHLQTAGHALLARLDDGDRAALVTFSHVVRLREALTNNVARVRQTLASVVPSGETSLVDGSYGAMALAGSDVGRSLLLVFSDGVDTASWLSPSVVLDAARRADVVVYGVAVRGRLGPKFLRDLAGLTGGSVFEVDSTKDLSPAFVRILDEVRQRYLLSFSPRGVPGAGWHRLDVKVKGRRAMVSARTGYQAER